MAEQESGRPPRELVILAGATVFLSFIGSVLPQFLVFAPVPVGVLTFRHSLRYGIGVAVISALLAGMIHPVAMPLVLLVLGVGIAIGGALRESYSAPQVLMAGVASIVVAMLLLTAVTQFALPPEAKQQMFERWQEAVKDTATRLNLNERLPEQGATSERAVEQFLAHATRLFPGSLLLSSLASAFLYYWLIWQVLLRMGDRPTWFKPFRYLRFPWPMAWGYIIGRGAVLLSGLHQSDLMLTVGANLELVFSQLFFIQGLSILWFYFDQRNMGWIRYLIALTVYVIPWFYSAVVLVGLLDTWFNFRRLQDERVDET